MRCCFGEDRQSGERQKVAMAVRIFCSFAKKIEKKKNEAKTNTKRGAKVKATDRTAEKATKRSRGSRGDIRSLDLPSEEGMVGPGY